MLHKRAICATMAMIFALVFCACGKTNEEDPTKTYLRIGNFDGGVGHVWLENAIADFQREYSDFEFEPGSGKKGCVIEIYNKKDEYTGATLQGNMPYYKEDLYFLNDIEYNSFVSAGVLADITSIVTADVYDNNANLVGDNGTLSIADNIKDVALADYFNVGTQEEPQYYGLPFQTAIGGITYDADLFDEYGLYFKDDNGTLGATQADIDAKKCSTGPDGKLGTYDDGMPNTWNQFIALMNRMLVKGITPFTWSGANTYQRNFACYSVWSSYEGYNDFMLNQSFSGTNAKGEVITEKNAYQLADQQGRKAMLQFCYDILSNTKYYSSVAFNGTQTHTQAQKEFVYSINTNERIAMLLEASWWENETRSTFDSMSKIDTEWGYGKRNFRILPIPKFVGVAGLEDQVNQDSVMFSVGGKSLTCVNNATVTERPEKMLLVEKFLQFIHQRSQMANFSRDTSCLKPFNYEFEDSERDQLTNYMKSILDMYSAGTKVTYALDSMNAYKGANKTYFEKWNFGTQVGANVYNEPLTAFHENEGLTVDAYFNGIKSLYNQNTWPIK